MKKVILSLALLLSSSIFAAESDAAAKTDEASAKVSRFACVGTKLEEAVQHPRVHASAAALVAFHLNQGKTSVTDKAITRAGVFAVEGFLLDGKDAVESAKYGAVAGLAETVVHGVEHLPFVGDKVQRVLSLHPAVREVAVNAAHIGLSSLLPKIQS